MADSSTAEHAPFTLLEASNHHNPHLFEAYRYDRHCSQCWTEIVEGCLTCWRITAQAFYERIPETGFQKLGIGSILNPYGVAQLPSTPLENANVTKKPAITDLTEVLALRLLHWKKSSMTVPYPRVLHKEVFQLQHHGIDALGYELTTNGHLLYVIEVMASVDLDHPPTTVKDHYGQILDETLNVDRSPRLLRDLQTAHDESDDTHKDVLNGFITAVIDGTISNGVSVVATPLLVRRFNEHNANDWAPFVNNSQSFEDAAIPSYVFFLTVECHESFSGMLELVKQTVTQQKGD